MGTTYTIPCKIGDIAWCIRNYKGNNHPTMGIVSEIYFNKDMEVIVALQHIGRGEWGKKIFGTEQETWDAIRERENK